MGRENGHDQPLEEKLKDLMEFAQAVDLEEVVWEAGGKRLAFRRDVSARLSTDARSASPAAPKKEALASDAKSTGSDVHYITSPMVGTFWRSAVPDRPPLVLEGDHIDTGERVAVVEAMKIPKDVMSPIKGKIKKIMAENGKAVEYGQKLFEVEIV